MGSDNLRLDQQYLSTMLPAFHIVGAYSQYISRDEWMEYPHDSVQRLFANVVFLDWCELSRNHLFVWLISNIL